MRSYKKCIANQNAIQKKNSKAYRKQYLKTNVNLMDTSTDHNLIRIALGLNLPYPVSRRLGMFQPNFQIPLRNLKYYVGWTDQMIQLYCIKIKN